MTFGVTGIGTGTAAGTETEIGAGIAAGTETGNTAVTTVNKATAVNRAKDDQQRTTTADVTGIAATTENQAGRIPVTEMVINEETGDAAECGNGGVTGQTTEIGTDADVEAERAGTATGHTAGAVHQQCRSDQHSATIDHMTH